MDTAEFFIKGLVVGFLVAAPVGPVAVMCIHRTIAHGRLAGYVCGLGASLADTVFGAVAALGLGFIASEIIANQGWLRIVGGTILCVLGVKLVLSRHLGRRASVQELVEERDEFREREAAEPERQDLHDHIANFASAFAVMITNPITLFSFAAIFAAIDIGGIGNKAQWALSLIAGVFVGGATWWSSLILVSALFSNRVDAKGILWINRCSGVLILVFGAVVLFWPGSLPAAAGAVP